MPKGLDTTIVDLHRVGRRALQIRAVRGAAWRVKDPSEPGIPMTVGDDLRVGETVVLAPESELVLDTMVLAGGRHGRAHAFVPEDAFKVSPSLEDVPRLVEQLEQLEQQVASGVTDDPLAEQRGPRTAFDRAMSTEFAIQNLSAQAGQLLAADVARGQGAVCLFLHGDAACVAMARLSVPRVRAVMDAMQRPVNPHLVDDETLRALLDMVYGPELGEQPS